MISIYHNVETDLLQTVFSFWKKGLARKLTHDENSFSYVNERVSNGAESEDAERSDTRNQIFIMSRFE